MQPSKPSSDKTGLTKVVKVPLWNSILKDPFGFVSIGSPSIKKKLRKVENKSITKKEERVSPLRPLWKRYFTS